MRTPGNAGRDTQIEERGYLSKGKMLRKGKMRGQKEGGMEAMPGPGKPGVVQPIPASLQERMCTHSRLIDDVLSDDGRWTGRVICLECLAVIADPYRK